LNAYLDALADSQITLGPWWLGVGGLVLLLTSQLVVRRARSWLNEQQHISVEDFESISKPFQTKYIFAQLAFASTAFILSAYVGEPALTFAGGGLVIAFATALGLNVHSLLYAKALTQDSGVDGKLRLSPPFVMRNWGYRAIGAATFLLASGAIFANLAFLGGALFVMSGGYGYIRKSRTLRTQP
jgi:hypothetical protein